MLRFSLKDVFTSTTLIAIGLAVLSLICPAYSEVSIGVYALWFGAGASIGAGVFVPFRKIWLGATIGLLVQLLLLDLMKPTVRGAFHRSLPREDRVDVIQTSRKLKKVRNLAARSAERQLR